MNANEQKFFEVLIEKRIIYAYGEINSEMARLFGKAIIYLNSINSEKITLYFDSPGGDVAAGLDMFDMIKHSNSPIDGIVYRQASSMAAIVLQACRKRIAMPNSDITIHFTTIKAYQTWELLDAKKRNEILKKVKAIQDKIIKMFARTGRSKQEIFDQLKKDEKMSATEALSFGLIDEISYKSK